MARSAAARPRAAAARPRTEARSVKESSGDAERRVIVVGAGLAGISSAARLRELNLGVTVLESENDVGGRLATRELCGGRADSGAQFFTARSTRFRTTVETWTRHGLAYEWSYGWTDQSLVNNARAGHARHAARRGMGALAEALAEDLDIRTGARVAAVARRAEGWRVETEDGARHQARAVLLTPPAPLSLALLDAGGVELAGEDRRALERIEFDPCLSALLALDGPSRIPPPGAVQGLSDDVAWVADNRHKGISPERTVLTVHLSARASRRLWDGADEEIGQRVAVWLRELIPEESRVTGLVVDRWRHALPVSIHDEPVLVASVAPPLAFAGDAFAGPRVEGAALSGSAAADEIARSIGPPRR